MVQYCLVQYKLYRRDLGLTAYFKQLEQESEDTKNIRLLFSFLKPSSIPEMVLHRGSSPQKWWGIEDEGVDECLTTVLQNDSDFDIAVENFCPSH
jgi:hypothetical protein